MCPLYVSGLIGPGDRKSIQPMARRLGFGEYDQLHHWDARPVETDLLVQADRLIGGSDAVVSSRWLSCPRSAVTPWNCSNVTRASSPGSAG